MSSSGHRKLLSVDTLEEAARDVTAIARSEKERVALVGGFALQLYGSPRLTGDIDIIADRPLEGLPHRGSLTFGGYKSLSPTKVPVDVVIRDDVYAPLYEDALVHAKLFHTMKVLVARLEHITAMKIVAGRTRDDADLEFIISETDVDIVKTEKIINKFLGLYAVTEFRNLVEEVKWKKSRGKL